MAKYKKQTVSKQVDVEEVDEYAAQDMTEEEIDGVEVLEEEIVCNMELTKADVTALLWGLETLLNEYDLDENEMGISFKSLLEGLKGV